MRALDAAAAALGVPTRRLMEAAGRAVAEAVSRRGGGAVDVLVGTGGNGGDGWVAARLLAQRGFDVRVLEAQPGRYSQADAADAAQTYRGARDALDAPLRADAMIVDALFGAGLSRPLEGAAARLAHELAGQAKRVIAVDVPSGVSGDGIDLGGPHFRAGETVTFERKKPAHLLYPWREACGVIEVAKIGAPAEAFAGIAARVFENAPALWADAFPWPAAMTHKHKRGSLFVLSGPLHRTGAARLAAQAGLRSGAGLVTVLCPPDALAVHAAHLTAVMLCPIADAGEIAEATAKATAIVAGPALGLDDAARHKVRAVLAGRAPAVLDADALTLLAPLSETLPDRTVLTPHVGEFERLFPGVLARAENRIEAVREAARRAGCTVLLKGPDTTIAAPDGLAAVNVAGSPFLATAGSGDVLAGVIGGLLAQGMEGFVAACAGAWLHGVTGELIGPGLIAEDLPDALRKALGILAEETLTAPGVSRLSSSSVK